MDVFNTGSHRVYRDQDMGFRFYLEAGPSTMTFVVDQAPRNDFNVDRFVLERC